MEGAGAELELALPAAARCPLSPAAARLMSLCCSCPPRPCELPAPCMQHTHSHTAIAQHAHTGALACRQPPHRALQLATGATGVSAPLWGLEYYGESRVGIATRRVALSHGHKQGKLGKEEGGVKRRALSRQGT